MRHTGQTVVWVCRFPDRPNLVLQWHDATGRRRSRTTGTPDRRAAERMRADLEYELRHGHYREPVALTWQAFRQLFEQEYLAPLRPRTRENSLETFDAFERLCCPSTLAGVNERMLSRFAALLRTTPTTGGKPGLAPSTVKLRLVHLRTALRWAKGQRLIPEVPEVPKVKVPRRKPQPVPGEAFERLLQAAGDDGEMRAFLLCGWLAGLRIGEAYALRWGPAPDAPWLDLEGGRVVFPADAAKGCEDQQVGLDPELRAALESLPRPGGGKRVFRFEARTGPARCVGVDAVATRVRALARRAGVRLSMHPLRRGFVCRWAERVPAQVLQEISRHRSIGTTMAFYAATQAAALDAVRGDSRNASRNNTPSERGKPPKT